MSFIDINPDLKETNKLLDRIARALEVDIREKFGIYLGHCSEPASDPNPNEKPTVAYATDESTTRNQLIELMKGVKGVEEERELEQDREEFGI